MKFTARVRGVAIRGVGGVESGARWRRCQCLSMG
jgi:hypothetical protein